MQVKKGLIVAKAVADIIQRVAVVRIKEGVIKTQAQVIITENGGKKAKNIYNYQFRWHISA